MSERYQKFTESEEEYFMKLLSRALQENKLKEFTGILDKLMSSDAVFTSKDDSLNK